MVLKFASFLTIWSCGILAADILMATQGGTKSHKIPFWELARGLIARGHNITFLSGFPADFNIEGLHEVTPTGLVEYIHNYTNWDLLGARMAGEMPIKPWDGLRYAFESCDAMLGDTETKELANRSFDLAVLDGAFPECFLGLMYQFKIPFMYINTVGFYTGSLSTAGNPVSYAITPNFYSRFTDTMSLYERAVNTAMQIGQNLMHMYVMRRTHIVLREHLGAHIPHPYDLSRNVSFILQNGHAVLSYPRAFNPNVAEVACIHCKAAKKLPRNLEEFVGASGVSGFIYVSMGSSVKAANMPEALRRMLVRTFARLPYHVLWKYEGSSADIKDLTSNVKLLRWLPQQDILGHPKLRAFVTHGGLLSMFETVFHGVPVVTMPVFCDHDVNSAKAELDGYAIKLDLQTLSINQLYKAIMKVIHDPRFKSAARYRQKLLLDQRSTALDTAIYWTEYVLRHKGAYHLQASSRNMTWWQYYLLDVVAVYLTLLYGLFLLIKRIDFRSEKLQSLQLLTSASYSEVKTKSKKL
ncbi:UDP-glucuronosyltransferase 2C1 isoform X1 [Drosophila gunungcola]|uniref:UDP-glucuronosyltransferase 2C1 isoform X1 n=2 Tax=Drosophila gunungcola TaxID=103775 RepID=UPI0022DF41CE|nr:UDP-glucuronosyltransferase 2C1 isoform X1 [Drosophila gunungcola]XP_052842640.1 UDP-glucuronosyltransferase 2C1 isoform X1 [Drosophila gunungcola]XP_052842641.1 UDP-glucuronosyltransferase 2C1 isoform X1 [Drosophila gunungcola]XP_052842642.1 UDP-glucuronosyltransferase 2C1 isoform X1 [Drosophila gunungcola]XP_052842643.1 UDP-glucuronosyltransferase 2C1 isoform X1 [Drosophila gunungcola]XP_052842645.1 UDP-glucuronosyltransferase 2C1 isoform X1 [Drosophila gunungcola]XP_052842646.1 UDP-gluc